MRKKTVLLLDTNILLDFALARNGKENLQSIKNIFKNIESWYIQGIVAFQSVPTCIYILEKEKTHIEVIKYISYVAENFTIQWSNNITILNALKLNFKDTEDALIAQCALESWADYIITNNLKDFKHSPLTALSPVQFVTWHMHI